MNKETNIIDFEKAKQKRDSNLRQQLTFIFSGQDFSNYLEKLRAQGEEKLTHENTKYMVYVRREIPKWRRAILKMSELSRSEEKPSDKLIAELETVLYQLLEDWKTDYILEATALYLQTHQDQKLAEDLQLIENFIKQVKRHPDWQRKSGEILLFSAENSQIGGELKEEIKPETVSQETDEYPQTFWGAGKEKIGDDESGYFYPVVDLFDQKEDKK